MPFETHRIPSQGIHPHVRTAGSGTPLLLLHDFPGPCALWAAMIPGLIAAGHRVIAPDQRGFGESDIRANSPGVVWSSDDHDLAEGQMQHSSRQMGARWEHVRIDGAGHWPPLERPQRINDLAAGWFA